jgi:hypothetical protein
MAAAEAPRARGARSRDGVFERGVAGVAAAAGIAAWLAYAHAGLTLSHYDARAHLVVARRVIDSLTPGWHQVGAVWLPLPHLINALPAQVDALYRTGAFASAVSIACLAITAWATSRLVRRMTGSWLGAGVAAALLLLNPNLLYLSVTPMTEPLLLAADAVAVLRLYEWTRGGGGRVPRSLDAALFATMWTRYEAWLVIPSALAAAGLALWRGGLSPGPALWRTLRLAAWPAAAVLLFLLNSRATVGCWFVSGGFYVRDPAYDGHAARSLLAVWWGTHVLSGYVVEIAGLGGAAAVCVAVVRDPRRAAWLVPVALFAAAVLPAYAFFEGHPFRIRYMVPAVAACATFAGIAAGLVVQGGPGGRGRGRLGLAAAGLLIGSSLVESPPFARGPMVEEATWDAVASDGRRRVTACLGEWRPGDKIMASMGSLAHYMHDLAQEGLAISDFIHEGNGAIWTLALETGPALHARWLLVEEQSEGGDVLARRVQDQPDFATGMLRVCEGGGVALYRRTP